MNTEIASPHVDEKMAGFAQSFQSEESKAAIEAAIAKAFEVCAETQRLMALPYLTAEQVAKVYPVSKSVLDKMRMERIGPEFVQVKEKGTVAYTHKAVRDWLNRHRQRVL